MAKREPKSRHTTIIEVISRPGGRRGRIELGTGNIVYYRSSAKTPTLQLTYRQIVDLLERQVDYLEVDELNFKLPRSQSGDFVLSVQEIELDDSWFPLFQSVSSVRKLDPRRIDLGSYQFSPDMANGHKSKKYTWFAHLSIQAALWVVHRYIEKSLVDRRRSTTDRDTPISREDMQDILIKLYKRIAP